MELRKTRHIEFQVFINREIHRKKVPCVHLIERHDDVAKSGHGNVSGNLKAAPDLRFKICQFRVELINELRGHFSVTFLSCTAL